MASAGGLYPVETNVSMPWLSASIPVAAVNRGAEAMIARMPANTNTPNKSSFEVCDR